MSSGLATSSTCSCDVAESVVAQIRAEIQGGKTEWAAVAPYLPRATSTVATASVDALALQGTQDQIQVR